MTNRTRFAALVGAFLALAVIVLGIALVGERNMRPALADQMDSLLDHVTDESVGRTEELLRPATDQAEVFASLLARGVIDPADDAALEQSFTAVLAVHPQLSGMYLGRPDGSFLFVSRDATAAPDGLRTKRIVVDDTGRTVSLTYRDADGAEVASAIDDTDTYDPTQRPWYQLATTSGSGHWTEPYVFASSGQPGVTTSATVDDGSGLLGVVGVDLELSELSRFLGQLDVGAGGTAFIVDPTGDLVAYGLGEQVVRTGGGEEARQARPDEIGDPRVAEAYRLLTSGELADGRSYASFEVDGAAYRAEFVPLAAPEGWHVATVAAESDFIGDILDAQRRTAVMAVGIALIVFLVLVPVIVWGIHRLQRRGLTDPLTGLPNRRAFEAALDRAVARAANGIPVAAAQVDVDHFKAVNDTYGHAAGDRALQVVASRLRQGVRDHDVVSRTGGDEFAVLVVGSEPEEAAAILERIRRAVADEPVHTGNGDDVRISVTIGMAPAQPGDDVATLMERADQALYAAKEAGRNRVATPDGILTGT